MGCQAIGLFEQVSEFEVALHYYCFRRPGPLFADTKNINQKLSFLEITYNIIRIVHVKKLFSPQLSRRLADELKKRLVKKILHPGKKIKRAVALCMCYTC